MSGANWGRKRFLEKVFIHSTSGKVDANMNVSVRRFDAFTIL